MTLCGVVASQAALTEAADARLVQVETRKDALAGFDQTHRGVAARPRVCTES